MEKMSAQKDIPTELKGPVNISNLSMIPNDKVSILPLPHIMPTPEEFSLPDEDYLPLKLKLNSDESDRHIHSSCGYSSSSSRSRSSSCSNTDESLSSISVSSKRSMGRAVFKSNSSQKISQRNMTVFNTKAKKTKSVKNSEHLNSEKNNTRNVLPLSGTLGGNILSLPSTITEASDNEINSYDIENQFTLKCDPLILERNSGIVVKVYCIDDVLVVIQVKKVKFLKLQRKLNSLVQGEWVLIGSVPHKRVSGANFLGECASEITSNKISVLYCELWKSEFFSLNHKENTRLLASLYYCTAEKSHVKCSILELDVIEGCILDLNFYVLNDKSLFVCYSSTNKPIGFTGGYYGRVRKYFLNNKLNGAAKPRKFTFTASPVMYLHCTYDSPCVLGHNDHMLYMWNHQDTNRFNSIIVKSSIGDEWIHWSKENKNLLLLLVGKETRLEYIAYHLRSARLKVLHSYVFPRLFQEMVGAYMNGNMVAAVFRNGIANWDFESADLLSTVEFMKCDVYLGKRYVISVKANTVDTIPLFFNRTIALDS